VKTARFFNLCMVLLILLLVSAVPVDAALDDNSDGTVTQTRNDGSVLMWLQDAKYALTSGYCSTQANCDQNNGTGSMNWNQGITWANSLVYAGYDDWRLPEALPVNGVNYNFVGATYDGTSDFEYNITSPNSELAYMFNVELENIGYFDTSGNGPQAGWEILHTGPFDNLIKNQYWSGTDIEPDPGTAIVFDSLYVSQGNQLRTDSFHTWAVRDVTVVPEPLSSTLFIIGGATLGFRRFMRGRK